MKKLVIKQYIKYVAHFLSCWNDFILSTINKHSKGAICLKIRFEYSFESIGIKEIEALERKYNIELPEDYK